MGDLIHWSLYLLLWARIPKKKWTIPHNQQKYKMQYLGTVSKKKKNRIISVWFQRKPFNITVIQVYAPTTDAEEPEADQFYEDLHHLLKLIPKKKDVLFLTEDWNAKVANQEIPRVTGKFGHGEQNEEKQRLAVWSRDHSGHRKILFQQPKRWLYTLTSSDGQY